MIDVLISIQPKWCDLIAVGEKTIDVRKTKPKLQPPFRCYIYQTKGHTNIGGCGFSILGRYRLGKVIGEFVCDWVESTTSWRLKGNTGFCAKRTEREELLPKMACLSIEEIEKYAGTEARLVFGWHISDLVIYDKPKELSDFSRHDNTYDNAFGWAFEDRAKSTPITRPPQSWCYVERKDGADNE